MKYGYGRVSSKGQKLYGTSYQEQFEILVEHGVPAENIYTDAYTGTKMSRDGLDQVLSLLRPGDELVVCKLDRLARTAAEGSLLVRDLVDQSVKVNILNMGVADNTPMGRLVVTVLFAFAEYERDMIVERTSAGKAYKREHDPNYREGRKPLNIDPGLIENLAQKQKDGFMTVADCCRELHVSRSSWYNLSRRYAV